MIQISNKYLQENVYFPKNSKDVSETYDLVLYNELTHLDYTVTGLTNKSNVNNYFVFDLCFRDTPDGEYDYSIKANDLVVGTGLIRIGEIKDSLPEIVNYDEDVPTIIQYYPKKKEIKYFKLTVNITSEFTDNLVDNAQVTVNCLSSSTTKTYVGEPLEFEIFPEVDYSVSFNDVLKYEKPLTISGKSIWDGKETVTAHYKYVYYYKYFTIEALSDGTINLSSNSEQNNKEYSYSTDNGNTWLTANTYYNPLNIEVNTGDKVLFKGENDCYEKNRFSSTCQFNVEGNIMSLLYGDNYSGQTEFKSGATFYYFFYECNIVNAENLVLPATTILRNSYVSMFNRCSNLITAPAIIGATTLATSCCSGMFYNCSSLKKAPKLPATTLANYCYNGMFYNCSSLTTAPVLPASTLVEGCYISMFMGCSSLNYVKCLAEDGVATNTSVWLSGVSPTGTFVKSANSETWSIGVSGIPSGWEIEEV